MGNLTDHFAGGGGSGNLLEQISFIADGRSVTAADGTTVYTSETATRVITSTSRQTWTGSTIAYKPPEGTKMLVYEFTPSIGHSQTTQLANLSLFIDDVEVQRSRRTYYGSSTYSSVEPFVCCLEVGASTENITEGKIGEWTSNKTLKIKYREHSSSHQHYINDLNYWDGSGTNTVAYPTLKITALS